MGHVPNKLCRIGTRRPLRLVALLVAALTTLDGLFPDGALAQGAGGGVHPWGLSPQAVRQLGTLVIAGGGALPEEIYEEFVRLAGGERARLVIIPSAHPFDSLEDAERAYRGWRQMGARSVEFVHAEDEDDANDEEAVASLRRATGAWIAGGSQGRLADLFVGTKVHDELKSLLDRGGVIGGTSAGASILSQTMIRRGTARRAVLDQGLGLCANAIVDQHFLERGREPRLLRALAENPDQWGIGVDEGTALIVRGRLIRVLGESQVNLYRATQGDRAAWSVELAAGGWRSLERILPP